MTVKMKPASRIAGAVHETARDMYEAGAISEARMAQYDALCLVAVPAAYGARKLKSLRRRHGISAEELATILNVAVTTVRQWEAGETRPRGSVLRLLELLDARGPEAVLAAPGPGTAHREASMRARRAI